MALCFAQDASLALIMKSMTSPEAYSSLVNPAPDARGKRATAAAEIADHFIFANELVVFGGDGWIYQENRLQAPLVYISLARNELSRAEHNSRPRDDRVLCMSTIVNPDTFLSQAEPKEAKNLIIAFLKVQRVGITGQVLENVLDIYMVHGRE
jgi:hypothetical protein